jgi:catechol 2,3-dioxygenase-like lactoylglutathione lyase family enzyme
MIGRLHHVVIDCPDPAALASFYAELTGMPIVWMSDDWVVIAPAVDTSGIAFQRAPDHRPPQWPDPSRPQQFHLDIMVDDADMARSRVVEMGGRQLAEKDGTHGVYADPVGHPFCLIPRPRWAPPIG